MQLSRTTYQAAGVPVITPSVALPPSSTSVRSSALPFFKSDIESSSVLNFHSKLTVVPNSVDPIESNNLVDHRVVRNNIDNPLTATTTSIAASANNIISSRKSPISSCTSTSQSSVIKQIPSAKYSPTYNTETQSSNKSLNKEAKKDTIAKKEDSQDNYTLPLSFQYILLDHNYVALPAALSNIKFSVVDGCFKTPASLPKSTVLSRSGATFNLSPTAIGAAEQQDGRVNAANCSPSSNNFMNCPSINKTTVVSSDSVITANNYKHLSSNQHSSTASVITFNKRSLTSNINLGNPNYKSSSVSPTNASATICNFSCLTAASPRGTIVVKPTSPSTVTPSVLLGSSGVISNNESRQINNSSAVITTSATGTRLSVSSSSRAAKSEESDLSEDDRTLDPQGEETETAPEAEGECDNSVTRCICDFQHDDGYMISCDTCLVWQHVDCVVLDRSSIPEEYYCERCRPRPVDKERAIRIQKVKIENKLCVGADSDDSYSSDSSIESRKITNRKRGGKGRRTARRKARIAKDDREPKTKRNLATRKSRQSSASFSSPPASPTQQVDEAEKKKQLLLERKKMLLEKKQETKQRSIRKQALSSRRNQDKSKANDESVTKNINNRDSWDEESGPHNDDEVSSVSNNSPTASGVQQLRQWIDSYEEAVTNHYSQELRSRLSAVKFNGLHSESKLPTALMSVAKCRVSLLATGYKILLASGNLSPNQPIIELKGKYLWTGALSFKQANISQNSPHVFYYKLPKEDIEICVDCRTYGNDTRFVRRSCKPNAEFRYCIEKMSLHLYLVATSAIDKNTEILINHYSSETASLCACGSQKDCQAHKVKYHSAQLNNKMSNKSAASTNSKENNRCHSSPHKADVISRINKRKHLRDQKEMRQSKKRKIVEKAKTRRYSRRKSSSSESDASSSHASNHSSSDSSSDPDDEDSSSTDSSPIVHRLPTASYPKPSNSATLIRLPHPQPEEDDIEKSPPVSPSRPPSTSSANHQQSQPQLQQQQMPRQYNRNVAAAKQSSDSLPRKEKQDKNEKQEKSEKTEKQGKPEKQEKLPEKQEKSMDKQEKQSRIRGKDVSLPLPAQNQQQANDHKMSREDRKLMAYIKAFERLEKKNTVQKGRGRRNRKSETDNGDSQDMHDLHDSKDKEDELSNSEFASSPKVDFTTAAGAHTQVSTGNLSDDTTAQCGGNNNNNYNNNNNSNNNNNNSDRKSLNKLKVHNDLESVKRKKSENYDKTSLNKLWRKSVKIKDENGKNSTEQNEDVKSSSISVKNIDSTDDEKDKSDNQTNDNCTVKKEHNVLTVGHVEIFDNRLPVNYKETIVENHMPTSEESVCRNERNIRSNKMSTSKRNSIYESRSGDTTDSEDQKKSEELNDISEKIRKSKNAFNNTSSSVIDHRAYVKHSSTELLSVNEDTSAGETPKVMSNERILSDDSEKEEIASLVNQDSADDSKSNSGSARSQETVDKNKATSDDESDKSKKEDNNSDSNSVADGTELNNAIMMEDTTGSSKKVLNDSSDEEESTSRTKVQKAKKTAANRGRTKPGRRGSASQIDEEKLSEGSLQDEIPTVRTTRAAARNKRMQTNFHDAIEQAYDLEKNRIGLRQRKSSLNEVRQVIDEKTMMEKLKRFRFKTDNEWSLDKEDTTNKTAVVNEVNSGNAKKRWLRQAISEEPQQNNDDRISPTGEYSGPFKKRRVYRESVSDQSSCSTPTSNQAQMQYGDEDDDCAVSQTSASTASILGHPAEVVNRQQNNLQNEWNSTINSVMEAAAKSNNIKQVVTSVAVLPVQEKQASNVNNELPLQQTEEDISALNDSYVINNKNLSELMLEPAKRKLSFVEYKQRKGSNSSTADVKLNNMVTALSVNNTDTSPTCALNSSQNSISVSANIEKSPSSSSFSSSPSDDENTVNSQPSTTVTEVIGKATQLIARSILLENMANSSSGSTTVNTTISKSSGVINVTDKRRISTSTSATVTTSDTFSVAAEGPSTPNMVQHRENLTERLRREFGLFVNDDEEGKSSAAAASKTQGTANSLSPIRIHVKTHVTESDNRNMLVTTCASVPQCTFIRPPPPALPPLQVPRFSSYPTTTVNYVKEQHSTQSPAAISPTHPVVIQQVNGGANRSTHPSSHITIVRGARPPSSCSTTSSSSSTSTSTSPTPTSSRLIRIPAANRSVMLPSTSFGTQLNSISTLPQHPSSRSSHSHAASLSPLLSQQSLALHPPLLSTLVTTPPPPPPPLPPLPPPLPPST